MTTVVGRVRPLFSLSRNVQGSFKASTTLHSTFFSTSTPRPEEPAWRSTTTTMTSSEAFTETMVDRGQCFYGCSGYLPCCRHKVHLRAARAERGAHGGRVLARDRQDGRVHRPERSRHHQLRHWRGRRLLGSQPGGCDHPRDWKPGQRPGRLPRDEPAAHLLR